MGPNHFQLLDDDDPDQGSGLNNAGKYIEVPGVHYGPNADVLG